MTIERKNRDKKNYGKTILTKFVEQRLEKRSYSRKSKINFTKTWKITIEKEKSFKKFYKHKIYFKKLK